MRNFSEFEKSLIRKIVETNLLNSNVLDVISSITLNNRGIELKNKEIALWCFKNDLNSLSELFETIALIKYLEKNDLIFIHTNYDFPNKGNFISHNLTQKIINEKVSQLVSQPIPTNIFDLINNYKKSYLVVGTELKRLSKNDFKTIDQLNHEKELAESRKQTKFSIRSFYIAILALIFSFLTPFLFATKIDEIQIEKNINDRKKNTERTIEELRTINKNLIKISDSIKNDFNVQTPNNAHKKLLN